MHKRGTERRHVTVVLSTWCGWTYIIRERRKRLRVGQDLGYSVMSCGNSAPFCKCTFVSGSQIGMFRIRRVGRGRSVLIVRVSVAGSQRCRWARGGHAIEIGQSG